MKMKNPKRVLITGIGGAIGVHMAAHLLEHTDWEIVGVDSFKAEDKGYYDRISALVEELGINGWEKDIEHPLTRLTVLTHDLCAPFTSREVDKIGTIDYIINLASRSDVQGSITDPVPFARNNVELMLTMLELAKQVLAPIKADGQHTTGYWGKFIQFSTDEVYGPASFHSDGHEEWDTIVPSNMYAASKAAQEAFAVASWRSYGIPLIITNTMNNFGEMQAPSKYPAMIQKLLAAGEPITVHTAPDGTSGSRYYLHSRNAADAVLFILNNIEARRHAPGEIDLPERFNIVGDRQITNEELPHIIGKLMGKKVKIRKVVFHAHNPGHDLHYGLNGSRLAAAGWKPPMTFEESMKRVIEWQQKHPEWMK